jgi:hypothetical protein
LLLIYSLQKEELAYFYIKPISTPISISFTLSEASLDSIAYKSTTIVFFLFFFLLFSKIPSVAYMFHNAGNIPFVFVLVDSIKL